MRWLSLITFGCWWVFMIVWFLKGRGNKESVHQQPRREANAYRIPMAAGILISTGFPRLFGPPLNALGLPLLPPAPGLFITSAVISTIGLAVALWARSTLGRNWDYAVTLKDGHELVTDGPYALVRHPIYTAVLLLFLSLMLLIPSICAIIGFALMAFSCWIKLRQEEQLMLQQFPERYPAYMARTKRLLPWLV